MTAIAICAGTPSAAYSAVIPTSTTAIPPGNEADGRRRHDDRRGVRKPEPLARRHHDQAEQCSIRNVAQCLRRECCREDSNRERPKDMKRLIENSEAWQQEVNHQGQKDDQRHEDARPEMKPIRVSPFVRRLALRSAQRVSRPSPRKVNQDPVLSRGEWPFAMYRAIIGFADRGREEFSPLIQVPATDLEVGPRCSERKLVISERTSASWPRRRWPPAVKPTNFPSWICSAV